MNLPTRIPGDALLTSAIRPGVLGHMALAIILINPNGAKSSWAAVYQHERIGAGW